MNVKFILKIAAVGGMIVSYIANTAISSMELSSEIAKRKKDSEEKTDEENKEEEES